MTVKIISKSVEICSFIIFPRCFKVKIYLIFAEISTEQISIVLIIPKLSRRIALMNANANQRSAQGAAQPFAFLTNRAGRFFEGDDVFLTRKGHYPKIFA